MSPWWWWLQFVLLRGRSWILHFKAGYHIHNPLPFMGQDSKPISVLKKMNRSARTAWLALQTANVSTEYPKQGSSPAKYRPLGNLAFLPGCVSRRLSNFTSTQHGFSFYQTTLQSVIFNLTSLRLYLNICGKQMASAYCQPVVTKASSKNCFLPTVANHN